MDEQRKKAFDFAQETSKQLITLATGIIGLTVTFGKDFAGGVEGCARFLAIASWVLFLLSILFGLMTLMAMTGSLEPKPGSNAPAVASIRGSNVIGPACIQVLLFFLALVAAVWFGIIAGHHSRPVGSQTSVASPTPTPTPAKLISTTPSPPPANSQMQSSNEPCGPCNHVSTPVVINCISCPCDHTADNCELCRGKKRGR